MKNWKLRQWVYHKNITSHEDAVHPRAAEELCVVAKEELIDTILIHFTEPIDEVIYPAKSFFVAIMYSFLLGAMFGEDLYVSLSDPDLLFNNDPYFVPFNSQTMDIYQGVLHRLPRQLNYELPQIKNVIEYFTKEMLMHDSTKHLVPGAKVLTECPFCHQQVNMATPFVHKGAEPQPGDVSMCSGCKNIAVFGEDLQLRIPHEQDLLNIDLLELQQVQSQLRKLE